MKRSLGLLALLVLIASTGGNSQEKPTLDALAWMAGSWSGTSRGIGMEEHWTRPNGNSMIGMHRDVGTGATVAVTLNGLRLLRAR